MNPPYDSNATIQTYSYSQFINYMDMLTEFCIQSSVGKES